MRRRGLAPADHHRPRRGRRPRRHAGGEQLAAARPRPPGRVLGRAHGQGRPAVGQHRQGEGDHPPAHRRPRRGRARGHPPGRQRGGRAARREGPQEGPADRGPDGQARVPAGARVRTRPATRTNRRTRSRGGPPPACRRTRPRRPAPRRLARPRRPPRRPTGRRPPRRPRARPPPRLRPRPRPADGSSTTTTTTTPEEDGGRRASSPPSPATALRRCACKVGPVGFEGSSLSRAKAELDTTTGSWRWRSRIKGSEKGTANKLFNACYSRHRRVPHRSRLAIVLDGQVQSASRRSRARTWPTNRPSRSPATSASPRPRTWPSCSATAPCRSSSSRSAEQQVSPTLGEASLDAGLLAGLIGLVAVALYMLLYYRGLGLVVILGLGVWSALMYAVICCLSASRGPGPVAGRGDRHHRVGRYDGRLLRRVLRAAEGRGPSGQDRSAARPSGASSGPSARSSPPTSPSLIGAFLLWWLTVGAGARASPSSSACRWCSTSCVAYCFTRPLVALLGPQPVLHRAPALRRRPRPRARTTPVATVGGGGMTAHRADRRRPQKRSIFRRLYHGETDFDFVGRWKLWFGDLRRGHPRSACRARRPRRPQPRHRLHRRQRGRSRPTAQSVDRRRGRASSGLGFNDIKVQERRRRPPRPDRGTSTGTDAEREQSAAARSSTALAELTGTTEAEVEVGSERGRPVVGRGDLREGAPGPRGLPRSPIVDLHHAPVRVPDGAGHAGRPGPRHPGRDRRLRDPPAAGHAGHRRRDPHDPRLLDLRRHRRVRPRRREHAPAHRRRPHDLQRDGRPVAQPGAHAVAEHPDHRPPPDPLGAARRARSSSGPPRSRSSAWPCSSASCPGPTRRSSSPRRSSPC